jgi:hypothetical protein
MRLPVADGEQDMLGLMPNFLENQGTIVLKTANAVFAMALPS